tara:strand:- start:1907 stop:3238 length:1332 start_codon:yes stop_codon:yes gene_type:complete
MSLYPDQLAAAVACEDWLNNTSTVVAGLWASAGFGKSFTTKNLIEEVILKNTNYSPVLTSMTHSAVGVMSDFTGRAVTTLHSLMGWIPQVDKDTGEEFLSTPRMRDKNADDILMGDMVLLIDEAGMLGHHETALLIEEATRTGCRILLIGDNKQCFPVFKDGERECVPAYENTDIYMELTIPKRVDENDMIYKMSTAMRKSVDGFRWPNMITALNPDESGKGVRVVDDIEELAYIAFAAGVRDNNTRNIKVLAFTNQRCLTLNRKIRKKVMGLSDPTPVVGEEMVANTSIMGSTGEALIRNNQMLIVKSVEKTTSYGMEGAFIQYSDLDGEDIEEIVFVPASIPKLADRLRAMSNEAKGLQGNGFVTEAKTVWKAFFSLKESVADIRFTYAMTVNKAQGTTLKHALVDLCDINICQSREQKARLAYTAFSRPTHFLTIEGELT